MFQHCETSHQQKMIAKAVHSITVGLYTHYAQYAMIAPFSCVKRNRIKEVCLSTPSGVISVYRWGSHPPRPFRFLPSPLPPFLFILFPYLTNLAMQQLLIFRFC